MYHKQKSSLRAIYDIGINVSRLIYNFQRKQRKLFYSNISADMQIKAINKNKM